MPHCNVRQADTHKPRGGDCVLVCVWCASVLLRRLDKALAIIEDFDHDKGNGAGQGQYRQKAQWRCGLQNQVGQKNGNDNGQHHDVGSPCFDVLCGTARVDFYHAVPHFILSHGQSLGVVLHQMTVTNRCKDYCMRPVNAGKQDLG